VHPHYVCHCRRRSPRSCRLASQPQAIFWTSTHRLHPNPNLRTTSTQGIGSGFREGPPHLLTWRSSCHHLCGYRSLKSSHHTARTSGKGLTQFAICLRMSAALNGAVALAYQQDLTQTGYNWSKHANNQVEYAARDSPACWMGHSGPVVHAWAPKDFAGDPEIRFRGLSWGKLVAKGGIWHLVACVNFY
jgi:hypothetical protein